MAAPAFTPATLKLSEAFDDALADGDEAALHAVLLSGADDLVTLAAAVRASNLAQTALADAVAAQNLCVAATALAAGAEPTLPLLADAAGASAPLTALLLAFGGDACLREFDADSADDSPTFYESPVHTAAANGQLEALRLLVRAGGSVHRALENPAEDGNTQTPLGAAVSDGHTEVVAFLTTECGVDVDTVDRNGTTCLQLGVYHDRISMVRCLLECGANAGALDFTGESALMYAARFGSAEAARVLLEAGAAPSAASGPLGWSPLHYAAAYGNVAVARVLLAAGGQIDLASTIHGSTPLHVAVSNGQLELATLLLDAGADASATDLLKGDTPFSVAAQEGSESAVALLLSRGAHVHPPGQLASPIYGAVTSGRLAVARTLLDAGADVNAPCVHWDLEARGGTLLSAVAALCFNSHKLETIRLLLRGGADVHARDTSGDTALHAAARFGYVAVAIELLHAGAAVYARGAGGRTALHLASVDSTVVRVLLTAGASVVLHDDTGATVFDRVLAPEWADRRNAVRFDALLLARATDTVAAFLAAGAR